MGTDEKCIFCKIANGEIPSATIYEDEDFRAILDISPASTGHAIIIPKEHAENLFELSDDMVSKALLVAKKVATAMNKELECDGINILQNNGEAAGQSVFHFHVHIIPRYKGDNINIKWETGIYTSEQLADIAERIKKYL